MKEDMEEAPATAASESSLATPRPVKNFDCSPLVRRKIVTVTTPY